MKAKQVYSPTLTEQYEGANGAGSPEARSEVNATTHSTTRYAAGDFFKVLDALSLLEEFGLPMAEPEGKPPLHIECSLKGEPTWGHHKHSCSCGTTWEHADSLPRLTTRDEFELAHTCPRCMTGKIFDKVWP